MTSQKESVERFETWLKDNGAEVLPTTSQWEVIRYRTKEDGLCIGYTNSKGRKNFNGTVAKHFQAFSRGKPMRKRSRPGSAARAALISQVVERDGPVCCLCGQFLNGNRTLEHWLPVAHGGTNHLSNAAAAHEACNSLMGDLSISEKIALRDQIRTEVEAIPPWEVLDVRFRNTRTQEKQS